MARLSLALAAVLILGLNGVLHGVWSQRWSSLTEAAVQDASARLDALPLKLGSWEGHVLPPDEADPPEEMVGHNRTIRFVQRGSGQTVVVYLACGHSRPMLLHTPLECYTANGYRTVATGSRKSPLPGMEGGKPEFHVATFAQKDADTPVSLRVFWSWKDAGRWQVPDNPGRTFRAAPFLYKLYAIRQVSRADEPLEGDLCLELLAELLPALDRALAGPQAGS